MATLFEEGSIQYMQLTKDRLAEAVQVARNSFFVDESICKAMNLKDNSKAMDEMEELFVKAAKDGLSVIAFDKVNDRIAGVSFNKLHVGDEPDEEYYQTFSDRCEDLATKAFLTFMIETDFVIDLHQHCNSDCYLEIMFLGVLLEYRGRSIAYNLCKASELTAQILNSGINMKLSIDETKLNLEPVPKCISAIFTSIVSQKLGPKLGMSVAGSVSLNKWSYKGQTFAERLGNASAEIQYHYKEIKSESTSSKL